MMRIFTAFLMAVVFTACSSKSSGGSTPSVSVGDTTVICDLSVSGQECDIHRDQTTAEAAQLTSACTASTAGNGSAGTIVMACPTTNLKGCCNSPSISEEVCYYTGQDTGASTAMLQATCETEPGASWSTTP
jgi:hypothetical protein